MKHHDQFAKITKKFILSFICKSDYQISKIPNDSINNNSIIEIQIGKYSLQADSSHALADILKTQPFYAWNLARLGKALKGKYKDLIAIDVGANIGDSVAIMRNYAHFPIVCIEGNEGYYQTLKKNLAVFQDTIAHQFYLGNKNQKFQLDIIKALGTLRIIPTASKKYLNLITLDRFITMFLQYSNVKLLKIDTDGFDVKVIEGGLQFIQKSKPVIFFEYDPLLASKHNDSPLKLLILLNKKYHYAKAVFYDNFGKFLISVDTLNYKSLKQLDNYIKNQPGAFPYYDVCLFHKEDTLLAEKFIASETRFFDSVTSKTFL